MKIAREHFIGVALGLIPVVMLYFALECRPFAKANQTAEQKNSMPLISEPYEASLDDIVFVGLQTEAITIDIHRYLGWFPDEKERLKKASVKAVDDLRTIKNYLGRLYFDEKLIELKKFNLANIDKLIQIYDGIELKSTDEIKKSFAEFIDVYSQYSEELAKAIRRNEPVTKLPKGFDSGKEEIKFAHNPQDRQVYLKAVNLIKEQRFDQAYKYLASLKDKYKDTAFEGCIKLKMSDCLLMAEPNEQSESLFKPEKAIALLSDILDDEEYSPILFDVFYKWRTETQSLWHGMSNISEIPDWQYNLKRWQVIKTIKRYLKTHPDDAWANAQVGLLLSLPNIGRGGPFGNDNLSHWGKLYTNIESEAE
mgnify:CR=1 FL=1